MSSSPGTLWVMADYLGVDVSPQAIDQRFTTATADLLQQVLLASVHQVIAADPVALPILQRLLQCPRPRQHQHWLTGCPDHHVARLR